MKKVAAAKLNIAEIQKDTFYKETKLTIKRNLTGEYSHQVVGYALSSLEAKLGKLAVSLLVKEIPDVVNIVMVPDEYLTV